MQVIIEVKHPFKPSVFLQFIGGAHMFYTIGEMAKRLGVPPSKLRYCGKERLLPFVERSSGGISVLKETGFEWL